MQSFEKEDQKLTDLLIDEGLPSYEGLKEEEILWHMSQMNKYFYEALSLKNVRIEVKKKHGALIGMIAAGLAMLVYMTLFVLEVNSFGINSVPIVIFAVVFYVLKDRIKEGMKSSIGKMPTVGFPITRLKSNPKKGSQSAS